MKTISSILIILFAGVVSVAQIKEKSINAPMGGTLELSSHYSEVVINTWNKEEVKVIYDGYEDDSDNIKLIRNGNTITIELENSYYSEDLEFYVPLKFNVEIFSIGGEISIVNSITGNLKLRTAAGDITLDKVTGNIDLNTGGGDISFGDISGNAKIVSMGGEVNTKTISGEAYINTGGGDVTIGNIGKTLSLKTGGGNIKIGNVEGSTEVYTGGGNVDANSLVQSATISTGGGNIKITNSGKGVSVNTGGGNIQIKKANGKIMLNTGAGNVEANIAPDSKSESTVRTGFGDINLAVAPDAKTTIQATIKNYVWWPGDDNEQGIKSEFTSSSYKVDKEENEIIAVYVLNGGGSVIKVETGSGVINIKSLK